MYPLYDGYSRYTRGLSDERYRPQMATGYLLDGEKGLNRQHPRQL